MPFIQTNQGRFFYLGHGSQGTVVYLLHGLTGTHKDWNAVPDYLVESGYRVFAFDMRGHGQSDKPEEGYSPEDHANDIDSFARALGHLKIHLVGHSAGGRNAMVCAALFPERVLTLTIVDTALKADPQNYLKGIEHYKAYPTPFSDEESLDRFLQDRYRQRPGNIPFFKSQFERKGNGTWDWIFYTKAAWMTQKLGGEKDAYEWLKGVQCPVLFLKGAESDDIPMEEVDKIRSLISKGRMAVVRAAGHDVFLDNPGEFFRILMPFLSQQR